MAESGDHEGSEKVVPRLRGSEAPTRAMDVVGSVRLCATCDNIRRAGNTRSGVRMAT
jgi:hypothetical protein